MTVNKKTIRSLLKNNYIQVDDFSENGASLGPCNKVFS